MQSSIIQGIPFHYQVSRFCFGVLISVLGVLNILPQSVRFLNKGPSVEQVAVQTRISHGDCFLPYLNVLLRTTTVTGIKGRSLSFCGSLKLILFEFGDKYRVQRKSMLQLAIRASCS